MKSAAYFILAILFLPVSASKAENDDRTYPIQYSQTLSDSVIALDDYLIVTITAEGRYREHGMGNPVGRFHNFTVDKISTARSEIIDKSFEYGLGCREIYTFILHPEKTGFFPVGGSAWAHLNFPPDTVRVVEHTDRKNCTDILSRHRINKDNQHIFLKSGLNRDDVFAGEQITLTTAVYHSVPLKLSDTRIPPITGCWIVPFDDTMGSKTIDGEHLQYEKKSSALFPLFAGVLTVDSVNHHYFASQGSFTQWGHLQTEPITITVHPLPEENRPPLFSGAVGNFTISAVQENETVGTREALRLKVAIRGSGNIGLVSADKKDFSPFEILETNVSEDIRTESGIVSGTRSWEYILSSGTTGTHELGQFSLSYFDPKHRRYKTALSEPVSITVMESVDTISNHSHFFDTRKSIEIRAVDLRYIKADKKQLAGPVRTRGPVYGLVLMYMISSSIFALAFLTKQKRDYFSLNPELRYRKNASKKAMRSMKALSKRDSQNVETAHDLRNTLLAFMRDGFSIDAQSLSRTELENSLRVSSIPAECIEDIMALLSEWDSMQYAPERHSSAAAGNQIERASKLIDSMSAYIRTGVAVR